MYVTVKQNPLHSSYHIHISMYVCMYNVMHIIMYVHMHAQTKISLTVHDSHTVQLMHQ